MLNEQTPGYIVIPNEALIRNVVVFHNATIRNCRLSNVTILLPKSLEHQFRNMPGAVVVTQERMYGLPAGNRNDARQVSRAWGRAKNWKARSVPNGT